MNLEILSQRGFKEAFESISKYEVKKGVDEMGIDGFINHCALLAAGTGAISGMGGAVTMIVGIPADIMNNIVQQFRVTLGVIYHRRGTYEIGFDEFMTIVALSIGVEVGIIMTRVILTKIAEKLLIQLGAKMPLRVIPLLGSVAGATTNYFFIKGIGESVKKLNLN